jgi:hypothetical protein
MQGLQVEEHPTWWREAPNSVRAGVYVSQANGSGNGIVFGYGAQNRKNKAPLCSIGNQRLVDSDIASDTLGNVYVPDFTTATSTSTRRIAASCLLGFTIHMAPGAT